MKGKRAMPRIRKSLSPETVNVALAAIDRDIEQSKSDQAVSDLAPLFAARQELISLGGTETESGSNGAVKRTRSNKKRGGLPVATTTEAEA
jgi:hypothetical protein